MFFNGHEKELERKKMLEDLQRDLESSKGRNLHYEDYIKNMKSKAAASEYGHAQRHEQLWKSLSESQNKAAKARMDFRNLEEKTGKLGPALEMYLGKNPKLAKGLKLGGAAGALGLGAYGLHHLLSKNDEQDEA